MVTVSHDADGLRVHAPAYRLWFRPDRPYAVLEDAHGARWAELLLAASVNTTTGLDDSAALSPVAVGGTPEVPELTVAAGSSLWQERSLLLRCHPDRLELGVEVVGDGALTDVHLLGGYVSAAPRWGSGFLGSGAGFASVLCPDPSTPERAVGSAAEAATLDVLGGALPGRGRWFFTPGPFCLALSRSPERDDGLPDGPWAALGLLASIEEQTFTGLHYEPGEEAFSLRLAYEGQTVVDGRWVSPTLVLTFDHADPYAAITDHATRVRERLPSTVTVAPAAWWSEPIFCGWGAQCHLAMAGATRNAADLSTRATYDDFLAGLAARGIHPGTIVIDDRWEVAYGSGEADPERWPELRRWIAERHAAGQRVLLWWKAWAPDAVPPELCVRNAAGRPVGVDPTNPAYVEFLAARVAGMLGPDGYDADGLKVDFTAMTPSGPAMSRHGSAWGVALLHRLLAVLHDAAHRVKPDALVITHTPNPAFGDVTDMIRLNDVQRLDSPSPGADFVAHMRHRARIARAALPDTLIDTDNWALPDRQTWRRYLAVQGELGVPSLYYVTHIDCSGEELTDEDFAALREAWVTYRRERGLA